MKNEIKIDPLPNPDGAPVIAIDEAAPEAAHNPELHETHNPELHESPPRVIIRKGKKVWAKRRGGAPKLQRGENSISRASQPQPSATPQPQPSATPQPQPSATPDSASNEKAKAVGAMAASAFVALCGMIGGDDFTPEEGELDSLTIASTAYCEAKGYTDLPPGIALTCVCAVFVAKRWNAPKFAEKRKNWMNGFKKSEKNDENDEEELVILE